MRDRMNLRAKRKRRGIQITQQTVAERNVPFEDPGNFVEIEGRFIGRLQQMQIHRLVRGHPAAPNNLRPAEKITLQEAVADIPATREPLDGLSFFGYGRTSRPVA